MLYKSIFNVVGVVAVVVVLLVGCGGDNGAGVDPNNNNNNVPNNPNNGGTYTEKGNNISKYKTIKVGTQTWMAENLDYAIAGSRCYADSLSNCTKYGRLYTWDAANRVCPSGWRLPNDTDWNILIDYVGGEETAGTKLKSSTGWMSYSGVPVGTDSYGFSALPGGYGNVGDDYAYFTLVSGASGWWSATESNLSAYKNSVYMFISSEKANTGPAALGNMLYVRCVQN
jgi:uncharacterized protein (TIGR02145 family)